MSRSGYSDDCEQWSPIRWRGQVASAIRGKRGQKLFADLLEALDEMPEKRLIKNDLVDSEGEVCALGAIGKARGVDLTTLDPENAEQVSSTFNIAECLAQEIVFMNDEYFWDDTPEDRFAKMRNWVAKNLKTEQSQ